MNEHISVGTAGDSGHGPQRTPIRLSSGFGNVLVVSAGFAVLMSVCGVALDLLLLRSHEGARFTMVISNSLAGVIAGALVFRLLQIGRERRARIEERLQTISDMNHHIRNALQVISFSVSSSADKEHLAGIHEALDRIQWTLREILPRIEPTFTPFDASRRRVPQGKLQDE